MTMDNDNNKNNTRDDQITQELTKLATFLGIKK